VNELSHRGLALSRSLFSIKILRDDDLRCQQRPCFGDFNIFLFENHLARIVGDFSGSAFPLDLIKGVDFGIAECSLNGSGLAISPFPILLTGKSQGSFFCPVVVLFDLDSLTFSACGENFSNWATAFDRACGPARRFWTTNFLSSINHGFPFYSVFRPEHPLTDLNGTPADLVQIRTV
jgi:hypothetical protein